MNVGEYKWVERWSFRLGGGSREEQVGAGVGKYGTVQWLDR